MSRHGQGAFWTRSNTFLVVLVGAGFCAGMLVGWLWWGLSSAKSIDGNPLRIKSQFHFISPLLVCGLDNNEILAEYTPLESKLKTIISLQEASHKASAVSVYVQNLNTGRWTGINEDELYAPASLAKVALLVAYLKTAEQNPPLLDKQILYRGPSKSASNEEDFPPMTIGKSYSIRDLLYRLVAYSDNNAKDYLHALLNQNTFNNVFTDLSLPAPALADIGDSMSVKSYSLFFRTLYNATYLNQPMSELALQLLSETKFDSGLLAGLPASTTVAHKFGHRHFETPQPGGITDELHDCGIVYIPEHPYFVCVMTKGWNIADLESTIQRISKSAYEDAISASQ